MATTYLCKKVLTTLNTIKGKHIEGLTISEIRTYCINGMKLRKNDLNNALLFLLKFNLITKTKEKKGIIVYNLSEYTKKIMKKSIKELEDLKKWFWLERFLILKS